MQLSVPSLPANIEMDCHFEKVMGGSAKEDKERRGRGKGKERSALQKNVFLTNVNVLFTFQSLCGFWHRPSKQVN